MREQLSGGDLAGTLPILYVYIARSGKTIRETSLVSLDRDGNLHPGMGGETKGMVPGVKIVLATGDGPPQTLYYFRTDLSNGGVNNSGFLKFAATLGNGHGLLKSASYLMHSGNFTQVRDFVLQHSQSVVQDDWGFHSRRSSRTSGISIRSEPISARSTSSPAAVSRDWASCSSAPRRRRWISVSAIAIGARIRICCSPCARSSSSWLATTQVTPPARGSQVAPPPQATAAIGSRDGGRGQSAGEERPVRALRRRAWRWVPDLAFVLTGGLPSTPCQRCCGRASGALDEAAERQGRFRRLHREFDMAARSLVSRSGLSALRAWRCLGIPGTSA